MNFLILSAANQKYLQQAIESAGHTWERFDPSNFQMLISNDPRGYDAVYLDGKPITRKRFDAIIPRIGSNRAFGERLLKHFAENLGVYSLQSGRAIGVVADKFRSAQILSAKKIRVPKQMLCRNLSPTDIEFVMKKIGIPMIMKPVSSSKGAGVFLLETDTGASLAIEALHKSETTYVLQEFIETKKDRGAQDIRAIVLDGKVVSAMLRVAPAGKIRANLSLDAQGEKVKLTPQQEQLAINSVAAIDGLNFAGVDILTKPHPDGDIDYLLELNSNPGTLICKITEHNHFEDVVKHLETMAPTYRRSWEQTHEKRTHPDWPEGVEMRDVASAYHAIRGLAIRNPKISDQEFINSVYEIEGRFERHGKWIVKRAMDIFTNES